MSTEDNGTKRSDYPYRNNCGSGYQGYTGLRPMSDKRQAELDAWLRLSKKERERGGV